MGFLADMTGTAPDSWRVVFAHKTVSSGSRPRRANTTEGNGYEFASSPLIGASWLSVWAEQQGYKGGLLASRRLRPNDLLIVKTCFGSDAAVVVLRCVSLDAANPQAQAQLVALQTEFEKDLQGVPWGVPLLLAMRDSR